jgi:hypothetical protein
VADGDVADLKGMVGCVAHKGYLTTARKGMDSRGGCRGMRDRVESF